MICANLQLTDYIADGRPERDDVVVVSAPLSEVLTGEFDGAAAVLGLTAEEILLAALGRTIVRTIGDGVVLVDLPGDTERTASVYPVELLCTGPAVTSASDMLAAVHRSVSALALRRMVPEDAHAQSSAAVLLVVDGDGELPAEPAALGHALELRAHRRDGVLVLDWWYDSRTFEAYTVEEMSEQFAYGLIDLTSEASAPVIAGTELAAAH
ncbi:MAG TPA: hypothetical protein VFL67_12005 [Mycobacterium sp.]|nr:hypothetical protein [Mycobacterium sp.]